MEVNYPPGEQSATPEYVLSVFKDQHRQACALNEGDPSVVLNLNTTIEEWRDADDLLAWRGLARALNAEWKIDCPIADWKRVLEPAGKKKLADVCGLIARVASQPLVRPAPVFGCRGASAGAFLTLRSLLHEVGAAAEEITPSTSLAPYTRRYPAVFLGPVSMLAPGMLPPVRVQRSSLSVATMWCCAAGFVGMFAGLIGGAPLLTAVSVILLLIAYLFLWVAALWDKPASVEFGELRTFRDLAKVIAAGSAA